MLCTFVLVTVAIEFYKGATAIRAKSGNNLLLSMVELTHRNTRRYGGYIVHIGIVLIFVGFTGAAFNIGSGHGAERWGNPRTVGRYTLKAKRDRSRARTRTTAGPGWIWASRKNGEDLGDDVSGAALLHRLQPADTEVAIRHRLNEDLYVNFRTAEDDEQRAVLKSHVNPLVSWVWMGYFVVLFGTSSA